MTKQQIKDAIAKALEPVIQKALHPEHYDSVGNKLRKREKPYRKPMEPRHRLSTRLVLLTAIKAAEIALMKESMEDTESFADAKRAL